MSRYRIVAKLIGWSVPVLNVFRSTKEWPYPFEQLADFEEGTLGKELHTFLDSRGLGYLPKYEEHDSYHALLGYGTTVTEELKLQAFMWGNRNATFAGKVLFILGYLVFPSKRITFSQEILRGKKAKALSVLRVSSMIPMNLVHLRDKLCID